MVVGKLMSLGLMGVLANAIAQVVLIADAFPAAWEVTAVLVVPKLEHTR